ncbi:hypothetical protein BJX76DRAFT_242441 [Aspergillus varians]
MSMVLQCGLPVTEPSRRHSASLQATQRKARSQDQSPESFFCVVHLTDLGQTHLPDGNRIVRYGVNPRVLWVCWTTDANGKFQHHNPCTARDAASTPSTVKHWIPFKLQTCKFDSSHTFDIEICLHWLFNGHTGVTSSPFILRCRIVLGRDISSRISAKHICLFVSIHTRRDSGHGWGSVTTSRIELKIRLDTHRSPLLKDILS